MPTYPNAKESMQRLWAAIQGGINTDGSLKTNPLIPNVQGYGKILEGSAKTENGVTFEDAQLDNGTGEAVGMAITLNAATCKIRIRTSAAAGYITLWTGGPAATGQQRPLVGGETWEEITFDFSTNNAQYQDGNGNGIANVMYITYGASLGAGKYLEIVSYATVIS